MKQKLKAFTLVFTLLMTAGLVVGCGSDTSANEGGSDAAASDAATKDVAMSYSSVEDAKKVVDGDDDSYLLVDVRKAEDFNAGHLPGAVGIDMDAAKNGDMEAGKAAMSEGLKEATGSETGGDKKLMLLCYSGKSYAQAATNILSDLGADMGNVTTLEGGMTAYSEAHPDDVAK